MGYSIHEVDPEASADALHFFNSLSTDIFPPLQERHFADGYWWIVFHGREEIIGFAGLVPMSPFQNVGYLKRCYIMPDHRGHNLQFKLLCAREERAQELGWSMLVSETKASNKYSANNFRKAGFVQFEPEQPWAENSIYWKKDL